MRGGRLQKTDRVLEALLHDDDDGVKVDALANIFCPNFQDGCSNYGTKRHHRKNASRWLLPSGAEYLLEPKQKIATERVISTGAPRWVMAHHAWGTVMLWKKSHSLPTQLAFAGGPFFFATTVSGSCDTSGGR